MNSLLWLRNEVDFRLRTTIRLQRGTARQPGEAKNSLFDDTVLLEVERLVAQYGLE